MYNPSPVCLHISLWGPPGSSISPRWHWCEAQRLSPYRRLMATLTASLLRSRPHDAMDAVVASLTRGATLLRLVFHG